MNPDVFIHNAYTTALSNVANNTPTVLPSHLATCKNNVDTILQRAEHSKGVYTVFLTSLVYKILHPEVDIRYHQADIKAGVGYSGRSFDTRHITPFLKKQSFPAMAESGWLTRSLEQKRPYDEEYPGAISAKGLKEAFLSTIATIQEGNVEELEQLLIYTLEKLIQQRDKKNISLATPHNITISKIMQLLEAHFEYPYKGAGAARLPVLAIYSAYQVFMQEITRFKEGYTLLPLESHTSADTRSGRCGDIDVVDLEGEAFESVEVKFGVPVTISLIDDCYQKFKSTRMQRYYILTTAPISEEERVLIEEKVEQIKQLHGCQVIVNGIYPSLRYYLRMMSDPTLFIECYTENMQSDKTIKYSHKETWNQLVMNS